MRNGGRARVTRCIENKDIPKPNGFCDGLHALHFCDITWGHRYAGATSDHQALSFEEGGLSSADEDNMAGSSFAERNGRLATDAATLFLNLEAIEKH